MLRWLVPETIVRHATPDDESALVDLYITLHREGLGKLFSYNYSKVVSGIQTATRRQGNICGVIDAPDRDGQLAGVVFILMQTWWWSDCVFLLLRECYVAPRYRKGTRYFNALMQFAKDIRESCNAARPEGHPPVLLEASFMAGDPRQLQLMEKLWTRWGRKTGSIHIVGL